MKRILFFLMATAAFSANAMGQSSEVRHDNRQIRHDYNEIRHDAYAQGRQW